MYLYKSAHVLHTSGYIMQMKHPHVTAQICWNVAILTICLYFKDL